MPRRAQNAIWQLRQRLHHASWPPPRSAWAPRVQARRTLSAGRRSFHRHACFGPGLPLTAVTAETNFTVDQRQTRSASATAEHASRQSLQTGSATAASNTVTASCESGRRQESLTGTSRRSRPRLKLTDTGQLEQGCQTPYDNGTARQTAPMLGGVKAEAGTIASANWRRPSPPGRRRRPGRIQESAASPSPYQHQRGSMSATLSPHQPFHRRKRHGILRFLVGDRFQYSDQQSTGGMDAQRASGIVTGNFLAATSRRAALCDARRKNAAYTIQRRARWQAGQTPSPRPVPGGAGLSVSALKEGTQPPPRQHRSVRPRSRRPSTGAHRTLLNRVRSSSTHRQPSSTTTPRAVCGNERLSPQMVTRDGHSAAPSRCLRRPAAARPASPPSAGHSASKPASSGNAHRGWMTALKLAATLYHNLNSVKDFSPSQALAASPINLSAIWAAPGSAQQHAPRQTGTPG